MLHQVQTLLAVFAHPDDETFRCGGTLALLVRRGVRVHLLTATRGEAGSCGDPPLCLPDQLAAVREGELRCACGVLGIEPPHLFDYRDGYLSQADPEQLTARILEVAREVGPQVILSFGPDGLSGHPDHIAVGRCATAAFAMAEDIAALYYVAVPRSLVQRLNMPHLRPLPDEAVTLTVDVLPVWEIKLAAMHCHATQLSSSPMARASIEQQRLFFGTEYFVCAGSRRPDADLLVRTFGQ